jgi:hypothetical protein
MLEVIKNKNYRIKTEELYFHDSEIDSINVFTNSKSGRSCEIIIDYYNWEGNSETNQAWQWKKLKLSFGFVAILDWNCPDFKNDWTSILSVEYDQKIEELYNLEQNLKNKYKRYESPLFDSVDNYLSITFMLSNFGDGLNEDYGILRLVGSNVKLEWIDENCLEGQIHIPINSKI